MSKGLFVFLYCRDSINKHVVAVYLSGKVEEKESKEKKKEKEEHDEEKGCVFICCLFSALY